MEISLDLGLLIGLFSIAVAVYFGLRGIPSTLKNIEGTLKNIEGHTSHITEIKETIIRLDERINTVLRYLPPLPPKGTGTVEFTLKNLGKVKVSAEPCKEETVYYIEVEKPVLKSGFIEKKSFETNLAEREKELLGREPLIIQIDDRRMTIRVPSSDPKVCREYIAYFLKWLDSTYWESLKEIKEYEKFAL